MTKTFEEIKYVLSSQWYRVTSEGDIFPNKRSPIQIATIIYHNSGFVIKASGKLFSDTDNMKRLARILLEHDIPAINFDKVRESRIESRYLVT